MEDNAAKVQTASAKANEARRSTAALLMLPVHLC